MTQPATKPHILVIIDTETGGLDPTKNALLSSAWIAVDTDLNVMDARYEVCRPEGETNDTNCTAQALNVNGFKQEDIAKRAFTDTKVANRLCKYFRQLSSHFEIVWVGQNASFDIGFINEKTDLPFPQYIVMDTKQSIGKLRTHFKKPNSSKAMGSFLSDFPQIKWRAGELNSSIFGVGDGVHHDARFDVCCCLAILELANTIK